MSECKHQPACPCAAEVERLDRIRRSEVDSADRAWRRAAELEAEVARLRASAPAPVEARPDVETGDDAPDACTAAFRRGIKFAFAYPEDARRKVGMAAPVEARETCPRCGEDFCACDPKDRPARAAPVESAPGADRWTYEPGRYEVRASCPKHPRAPLRRFGMVGRCSECGDATDLCGAILGHKECVREKGHPPDMHTSPSGSSWSAAPVSPPAEPLTEERIREALAQGARDRAVATMPGSGLGFKAAPPAEPGTCQDGHRCLKCHGVGWLWPHEVGDHVIDQRYTCHDCDGTGRRDT